MNYRNLIIYSMLAVLALTAAICFLAIRLKSFYSVFHPGANSKQFANAYDGTTLQDAGMYASDGNGKSRGLSFDEIQEINEAQLQKEYDKVENALDEMEEQMVVFLDPALDVNTLASKIDVSPSLLIRYFDAKKTTYARYVDDRRALYARQLMLNNPDEELLDVARKSGFPSLTRFCEAFSDYCGMSPDKFRFLFVCAPTNIQRNEQRLNASNSESCERK